ncbi:MAG: metallophosphoesterase [Algisphaera sp.]
MSSRPSRVVILSDTHLAEPGRGAGSAAALRPLWRGATRVIFNGDTCESGELRRRGWANEAVAELQDLCDADGVRLTLIAGNHDPYITDTHFARLRGGEVFVTHGDALHFAIAPWAESARRLTRHHRDVVGELEADGMGGMDAKLLAAKQASARQWWEEAYREDEERSPVQSYGGKLVMAAKALWYWRTEPIRAMDFAARYAPASRFFIFGHLHRAGTWKDADARNGAGRVIINTGAYRMPRWPRAVVIEGQQLGFWPVKYNATAGHTLGSTPLKTFALDNPPDEGDWADYPTDVALT